MTESRPLRTIKSFVRREGRITPSQESAYQTYWDQFGIPSDNPTLDWQTLFHRDNKFHRDSKRILEIGFGMGDALFTQAKQHPEQDFVGIEVYKPGIGSLFNQISREKISNIRVFHGDVTEFLNLTMSANSFDAIYIIHPDPWHKKRHHKRRLIQTTFIENLLSILKPLGYLVIKIDNDHYAEHAQITCDGIEQLKCLPTIPEHLRYPETKYGERAKRLNHQTHILSYQKQSETN